MIILVLTKRLYQVRFSIDLVKFLKEFVEEVHRFEYDRFSAY